MERGRVSLGLFAVIIATSWAAGGREGLSGVLAGLAAVAPWLLIVVGAFALIAAVSPVGVLVAPAIVVLAGLIALGVQRSWLAEPVVACALPQLALIGGVVLVLLPSPRRVGPEKRKLRAVVWPSRYVAHRPAARLTVTAAFLGSVTLDLTDAEFPFERNMHLFIRVVGGRVRVTFPTSWTLVAGDLTSAHGVNLVGQLSRREPHDEANPHEQIERAEPPNTVALQLRRHFQQWLRKYGQMTEPVSETDVSDITYPKHVVVISVAGVGGRVWIEYQK